MKLAFVTMAAVAGLAAPAGAVQHSGHHPPPAAEQPPSHAGHNPPAPATERPPSHAGHRSPAPAAERPSPHAGHQPASPASEPPADRAANHDAHREPAQPQPQAQHQGHDMAGMGTDHPPRRHAMTGALGSYVMAREASGTAWQPDASIHGGIHVTAGDWMLMFHGALNAVYSWQEGPRGDEQGFVAGMAMGMARRDLGPGTLQLRAMLSPDPLMGRRGYPLLLASGETADGATPLVDRQHPHDLFMELSASYSLPLGPDASLYLYGGLPGEPAFGPPAFMHRMSAMDSPEAPITHHWLDSTHITFGVVTAGLIVGNFKVEVSRFNGREPDEQRYDIETGPLDSTSVRLSWNPTRTLSLQASWAHLVEPEQLEPGENSTRWSASAIYTRPLGRDRWWSTTLAWGRRSGDHEHFDAVALESAVGLGAWTLFGRAEFTENNELLFAAGHHGPTFDVGKVSAGAIRDFRLGRNVRLGVGGLYALNFVPATLESLYGGDPSGAMAFIRLRID